MFNACQFHISTSKLIQHFRVPKEWNTLKRKHVYLGILRLNAHEKIIENEENKSRVALNEIFTSATKWNP